jgi:hypothetical protein
VNSPGDSVRSAPDELTCIMCGTRGDSIGFAHDCRDADEAEIKRLRRVEGAARASSRPGSRSSARTVRREGGHA